MTATTNEFSYRNSHEAFEIMQKGYPPIKICFDQLGKEMNPDIHCELIHNILKKILPKEILETSASEQKKSIHSLLPWMSHQLDNKIPGSLSIYVLHKYRSDAFKFFFEMVSRWLVPGKRLNVVLLYAIDFYFPTLSDDLYTLCEIIMTIDHQRDFDNIQSTLSSLEMEIKMGLESGFYARKILESKGLSSEEKTAILQVYIAHLIKRFPNQFNLDLINEMQQHMVIWKDEFKLIRVSRHLIRIISIHYLFRKWIQEAILAFPDKRYLSLKIFRALIKQEKNKHVLSFIVGVNLSQEKEIFQKKHLLTAIQNFLPSIVEVENSYFSNFTCSKGICTLYIEIEKKTGEEFSNQEILLLRRELPTDLKERIECPMHPIFMPRNDEEIMRNILALSHQIKYVRDIPQVTISFDEQTGEHLFFTVILVRILKPMDKPIHELFSSSNSQLHYIHDRSKHLGLIRKKYAKEADVFRLKLPKKNYLRKDHSIDLLKARQFIINELNHKVGAVRDFNGGMIFKQNELLCILRQSLQELKYSELLLENFFCSLLPIGSRAVIDPLVLKKKFTMLVTTLDSTALDDYGYIFNAELDSEHVYVIIKEEQSIIKEKTNQLFARMGILPSDIIQSHVIEQGFSYLGYIYKCNDHNYQKRFLRILQSTIEETYVHKIIK